MHMSEHLILPQYVKFIETHLVVQYFTDLIFRLDQIYQQLNKHILILKQLGQSILDQCMISPGKEHLLYQNLTLVSKGPIHTTN
jgi:hypothetical protein